jgi:ABC-2 type transport system ATP-binding protein
MTSSDTAIKVESVSKDFRLPHEKNTTIKSAFINTLRGKKGRTVVKQHALKDINLDIKKGEFFGIVGRNGSGKSTLLKILAGIYQPTKGSIKVEGRLVPFIELGVGFNPELTGRENVFLNGAMLGFTRKEVERMYDDIVAFAEIGRFMDQKLKNYSSGMQVRLAFSMAVRAKADILLVDEVLAVGDADFQKKCFNYFKDLKKNKKTVIFVSHDMNAIREYCDRAALINKSSIVKTGSSAEVAKLYTRMFNDDAQGVNGAMSGTKRWGNKAVTVDKIAVKSKISNDDKEVSVKIVATANKEIENPVFGIMVKNAAAEPILGTNTVIKKVKTGVFKTGQVIEMTWEIPKIFSDGYYYIDLAVVQSDLITVCDWWEESVKFRVLNDENTPYITSPDIRVRIG